MERTSSSQGWSVFPLWCAKAREFGELWRENVRARLGPFCLTGQNQVFSAGQTGQMESDLSEGVDLYSSTERSNWIKVVTVIVQQPMEYFVLRVL